MAGFEFGTNYEITFFAQRSFIFLQTHRHFEPASSQTDMAGR